jgi:hypothetical protein
MKKLRWLLLLGAVMLEVGCGLPDVFFLQPPAVVTLAPGPGFFEFTNPGHDPKVNDINVNFTGVELYYKLYADPTQIELNAYDQSNPSDPSVQLSAKGFFPICLSTDHPANRTDPVIPIGTSLALAGSDVKIYINNPPATADSSYYVLVSGLNVIMGIIRRNIPDPIQTTNYKTFQQNQFTLTDPSYVSTDGDVSLIFSSLQSSIYIAMYAISFGYTGTSTPSRSAAVYLGYLPYAWN